MARELIWRLRLMRRQHDYKYHSIESGRLEFGGKMTGWLDEVRVSTVDRDHAGRNIPIRTRNQEHPCLRKTSIIFCRRFCLRI